MTDVLNKTHLVKRMLQEAVMVPAHPPRVATAGYRAVHRRLIVELDLPCIACGVTHSTLTDPARNPADALQMETHHHVIEWSLINAIDLAKFNARIVAKHRHSQPEKYAHDFTQSEMEAWIDHDPDNLWVLCDVHHRHSMVGIHSITYPIWGPQDLLIDGYEYTPPEAAHA